MAGFIWQLRSLLLYLLRQEELDFAVSLETHDDIVVSSGSDHIIAAIQTKHSWSGDLLTGHSVELWKTLRVWIYLLAKQHLSHDSMLILSTTARVGPDLRELVDAPRGKTDVENIRRRLDETSRISSNKEVADAMSDWRRLGKAQREFLAQRITIQEAQPRLAEVDELIDKRLLRSAVRPQAVRLFRESLIGWFDGLVAARLSSGGCKITVAEVVGKLAELFSLQAPAALISTQGEAEHPPLDEERRSDPPYLRQLNLLDAPDEHLVNAVAMFYRARAERESWRQTRPNAALELQSYDGDLKAKWRTIRLGALRTKLSDASNLIECGWRIHEECMNYHGNISGMLVPVHVANGTHYMLTNEPGSSPYIGWHPDYLNLLSPSKKEGE
ncbi:ABC-three component system protein [Corallococcus exiguus]